MKVIAIAAFVALMPLMGLSQTDKMTTVSQQFAGTWVLNKKKSSPNYISDNLKWTITVVGEEFRIKKTYIVGKSPYEYELTIYADNRGEKNVMPAVKNVPSQSIFSKTKWDKNNLVRRYKTSSYPTPMFTMEFVEKYSLSKDRNQMTVYRRVITSSFPDPTGQMNIPAKSVFDREK